MSKQKEEKGHSILSESYEVMINEQIEKKETLPTKINLSLLKYFWQAGLFTSNDPDNIPKFLRQIDIFKNFGITELRTLSKYLHLRTFEPGEKIFRQGDRGTGLYFVLNGEVNIYFEDVLAQPSRNRSDENSKNDNKSGNKNDHNNDYSNAYKIVSLKRLCHFGELALIQDNNLRSATAKAEVASKLLGIFRPDLEEMLESDPITAAKLLQSLAGIVVNKLMAVTEEVRFLSKKLSTKELAKELAKESDKESDKEKGGRL
ncbi:MAG: cyclic nucleotide-binding domain-containing protein [Oligoflexia bacterium]|nr:cyclic nucleotide-binding domain-containing protein [Oligoflexia bacterium]